ncbi:uncharacterized protein [Anabrus simplex]|uniref:uncharacterized protein n=1 Tax=Anabrus simplex TaxID=316456 RepID=UPI0035A38646
MIRRTRKPKQNPKITALRQEGHEEYDIVEDLPRLKDKTKRIHIGWLFDIKGRPALRDLCRMLDSTADSISIPGWKDLAFKLQLDPQTVGCITNRTFLGETETYYTLMTAAQDSVKTLTDVVAALEDIKRFDVLQQSWESMERLATDILENEKTSTSSPSDDVIKPSCIPVPPALVLQSENSQCNAVTVTQSDVQTLVQKVFQLVPAAITQKIIEFEDQRRCDNILVANAAPAVHDVTPEIQRNVRRMHYDCTIMLTFASDGEEFIPDIVESLRRQRNDGKRIGVLILEEHSSKMEQNPQQFIFKLFHQVNFVMPVITRGYLRSIVNISPQLDSNADDYIDTKWTRYIYTLMNNDYIKRGCLNTKVRCLVPDSLLPLTQTHIRMREPIFETWYKVSDIEQVGNRLLANIIQRKLLSVAFPRNAPESVKS